MGENVAAKVGCCLHKGAVFVHVQINGVCRQMSVINAQLAGCKDSHAHLILKLTNGQPLCVFGQNESGNRAVGGHSQSKPFSVLI